MTNLGSPNQGPFGHGNWQNIDPVLERRIDTSIARNDTQSNVATFVDEQNRALAIIENADPADMTPLQEMGEPITDALRYEFDTEDPKGSMMAALNRGNVMAAQLGRQIIGVWARFYRTNESKWRITTAANGGCQANLFPQDPWKNRTVNMIVDSYNSLILDGSREAVENIHIDDREVYVEDRIALVSRGIAYAPFSDHLMNRASFEVDAASTAELLVGTEKGRTDKVAIASEILPASSAASRTLPRQPHVSPSKDLAQVTPIPTTAVVPGRVQPEPSNPAASQGNWFRIKIAEIKKPRRTPHPRTRGLLGSLAAVGAGLGTGGATALYAQRSRIRELTTEITTSWKNIPHRAAVMDTWRNRYRNGEYSLLDKVNSLVGMGYAALGGRADKYHEKHRSDAIYQDRSIWTDDALIHHDIERRRARKGEGIALLAAGAVAAGIVLRALGLFEHHNPGALDIPAPREPGNVGGNIPAHPYDSPSGSPLPHPLPPAEWQPEKFEVKGDSARSNSYQGLIHQEGDALYGDRFTGGDAARVYAAAHAKFGDDFISFDTPHSGPDVYTMRNGDVGLRYAGPAHWASRDIEQFIHDEIARQAADKKN